MVEGFQAPFIDEMSHEVKIAEQYSSSPVDASGTMDTLGVSMWMRSWEVDGDSMYMYCSVR